MTVDKQHILHDLNLKESFYSSNHSTPMMFSRDSSMETLSSFNVNFHSNNSTYTSEHSTNPSGILSPSDIPDSPPRGCDDDLDGLDQRSFVQPLNNTNSTGRTLVQEPSKFNPDDDDDDRHSNDVDSIRNYATTSQMFSYHDDGDIDDHDGDDDNDSVHSSLSSLTLPPPPSTSTATVLSNLNELRNRKHNLSVINEESLHENHERRNLSMDMSRTTTDDDDEDEDQKGKQLLFALIRQRLPHHQISLANASSSSSNINLNNKSQSSSSSSSCINDQTMREDLSAHDITIPSSTMQESGYDSLLPCGSAPKRSLSNASLSTTCSVKIRKKHRCNEENDDPMHSQSNTDITDDDDEHYDKKAGEALLRNLIAQVLPSFNPRYLNGDTEDDDEVLSNPRRPSPISRANSSSTASSIRSVDLEIEMTKKSDKTFPIRSNNNQISEMMPQEKMKNPTSFSQIHSKRSFIHKPVHQTKTSELRRLQTQSRR